METLEQFGRSFVPKRFRLPLYEYVRKAGWSTIPYKGFAILFFIIVAITAIIYFIYLVPLLVGLNVFIAGAYTFLGWLVVLGGLSIFAMFLVWSLLNIKIYNRVKKMEERLPDYLTLVVTNLRSGMSFDKSLWSAIRPEFGVLSEEIGKVAKEVMTGTDTAESLGRFITRYDSPILRRSITLIISELKSGGEVAGVIEKVIENLKKTTSLKKEMAASVVSYMLFISIIVLFLAPLLFALANTILKVILGFAQQIANAPAQNFAGGAGQLIQSLSALAESGDALVENFKFFSYLAIAVISMFSGMIVSIIEKGDIRGGIKYIPVFMSISLVVFYFALKALNAVFGGLV